MTTPETPDPAADTTEPPTPSSSSRPRAAERLARRERRTTSVTLALDPNDAETLAEARAAAKRAQALVDRLTDSVDPDRRANAEAAAAAAADQLAAHQAAMVTFTVHMRAIGPARVEALLHAHRPTDKQRRDAKALANGDPKAQPTYNEDTFPPALLAEVITGIDFSDGDTSGPLSVEEVADMWRESSQGDRILLMQSAMLLDQAPSRVEALGND